MFVSAFFVIMAATSSLMTVNGAVYQRDTNSTSGAPHPTSPTTTSLLPSSVYPPTTNASVPPITTSPLPSSVHPHTTNASAPPVTTSASTVVPPVNTTSPSTTSSTPIHTCTTGCVPPVTTTSSPPPPPPPTTTTPRPTSTPVPSGNANCNGIQQWQAAFAYDAGDQVIFNNQLFTAIQWTYNNAPPSHPDQWAAGGTCSQPINNQANCNGIAAWQSTVAYTTGNEVTFNNHLWSAVQWTESNTPGDTSGSWQDMGACA